jgi:hypothetical protein
MRGLFALFRENFTTKWIYASLFSPAVGGRADISDYWNTIVDSNRKIIRWKKKEKISTMRFNLINGVLSRYFLIDNEKIKR